MGKRRQKIISSRSQTLPSSPSHSFSNSSSSSSDFEFRISVSPRAKSTSTLCPADELFYKGQLLPLHLSPRLSMVRTLLLASSSSSSSSSATTSRDSTGSSNDSHSSFSSDLVLLSGADCDSSRPSSVTELDDEFKRLNNNNNGAGGNINHIQIKRNKYFSLSRFSSVFKKENSKENGTSPASSPAAAVSSSSSVKKLSTTAKEVIRKYLKKVKPLYEKLSQKQQQQQQMGGIGRSVRLDIEKTNIARKENNTNNSGGFSHSFSGNLRYPRRRNCVSSCPSSMRSSPSHSGVLTGRVGSSVHGMQMQYFSSDTSSMEELQSAIQGAIAHCKNSLLQNKSTTLVNPSFYDLEE